MSEKKIGWEPAFPISEEESDRIDSGVNIYTGVSIRLYMAGMAMQGLLSNSNCLYGTDTIASVSIACADELLRKEAL